ncbi:coiled-coil domain-containing protein 91-like isoform X1 [Mytilus edulis]|uniref:coiled-coil domain-containing protein 91-like isoform X1 n=1 Tax=Mytilus edulis TaxID=6550 RepID=UPI0039F13A5A
MDPGEEEDDFGDFGGFEVAEPVPPNVTQEQASGLEASPSPWAVFAAGSSPGSNVKPDLLCGQNRFPPVLDPSVPSSSADIILNDDTNNSNEGSSINTDRYDGTSGDQNGNLEDAILANDILDGSFKSTSSQHSSSGATSADLIRTVNLETTNRIQTLRSDSQTVDLVGDLLGASPGIVLVEDEHLENNYLDLGESNGPLVQNRNSSDRPTPLHISVSESSGECKTIDGTNPLPQLPASPSGSTHSSESHHMSGPILIDSLRKALHPKATVDVTKLSHKQAENGTISKTKPTQVQVDPLICEEIRQARLESQAAIATIVEQYKELSKQCISQQEEVLRECKQILQQEQKVQTQALRQQQKEEFSKAVEEEKLRLKKESSEMIQELVAEQKKEFDFQMEKEKENYEKRLQEGLEEEKERCRKELEEALENEKTQMNKKLEEEKEKLKEDLQEERQKYLLEMKTALLDEKEKNKESIRELLDQEKNHCRECVKAAVESVKGDFQSYIEQQKQKDKVVRHRQLSSLDVFLETAKQQLTMIMEDNQNDTGASKLQEEKKDET